MKKTWIKVKRGILDPKHRDALGMAIWLYLLMIDWTNWDDGCILTWRDQDAADALEVSIRTIREWRYRLEEKLYITSHQMQDHQKIRIRNWTNPREYSGMVYNKTKESDEDQGGRKLQPQGGRKLQPSEIQNDQGTTQGATQGGEKTAPFLFNSQITNHRTQLTSQSQSDHDSLIGQQLETLMNTMLSGINHEWKNTILKSEKQMDGKILKIITDHPKREEINMRMSKIRKAMAMANLEFAYFILVPPQEEEPEKEN